MSFSMIKERPFLFSPTAPIAVYTRIHGAWTEEQLHTAIGKALNSHALMRTRVKLTDSGTATYEPIPAAVVALQPFDCDFAALLRQEESHVFDLAHGEYTRFFYRAHENSMMLAVFLHQLVADCDGAGFLLADVARALTGAEPEEKPVNLYDPSWLPRGASMSLNTKISNAMLAMRWKKLKKSFSWKDRDLMAGHYWGWGTHATTFVLDALSPEDYTALKAQAEEQGISVQAAVAAALVSATGRSQKLRYSDSVRPEGYTGLGNFSITYAMDFTYDPMTSLWNNAYVVDHLIAERKNDPVLRYNQLLLIPQLPVTGIDAVYFTAYGDYKEPLAASYCQMFGLSGEPAGISITEADLPETDTLDMSVLAAPVPPNCLYAAAITPFMGGLIVTLRTEMACDPAELNWFHHAVDMLRPKGDAADTAAN